MLEAWKLVSDILPTIPGGGEWVLSDGSCIINFSHGVVVKLGDNGAEFKAPPLSLPYATIEFILKARNLHGALVAFKEGE